ncbi:S41 family peptidase [Aquimarina sp. D1M17]|uniref:S41 family peptidase n=1 Tax=Aquimarina acroporae TaxID=2937283 RepID=UPI0020BD773B|nr:S41 family peptidase [Aquimarina acroporae]MCK8523527.1 S41 family peptidase [Aquimarina acroporae]
MDTVKAKLLLLMSLLLIFSCSSDDDATPDSGSGTETINNPDQDIDQFIWSGLNAAYLYKSEVSNLANDAFATDQDLNKFLSNFATPEDTFDGLLTKRTVNIGGETFEIDAFSFIVDDYVALEQAFSGVSKSNGMDFRLTLVSDTSNDVLGYVRYVLPGTDAEAKGVKRGDFFNSVDGEKLTRTSDFNEIFGRDSYTIGLVTVNNGTVTETGTTVSLTQVEYTENPIFISKTIDHEGRKIGYMMYNSFVGDFDDELNTAFGQFKTDGIEELVLDLRYNGGGLVRSAIDMSSMITGQFNGEIFSREIWNAELQAQFSSGADGEEALINRFRNTIYTGDNINSLGLTKLYVLTTNRSASASELVINGLEPYIDVIQIGTTTSGKYQASITLYDSNGFGREGANPDHTYAIQPLVLKSANAAGKTDYIAGLAPDFEFQESILNLGTLGDPTEPMLKAALDVIVDGQIASARTKSETQFLGESIDWERKAMLPNYQKMYIDTNKFELVRKTLE